MRVSVRRDMLASTPESLLVMEGVRTMRERSIPIDLTIVGRIVHMYPPNQPFRQTTWLYDVGTRKGMMLGRGLVEDGKEFKLYKESAR